MASISVSEKTSPHAGPGDDPSGQRRRQQRWQEDEVDQPQPHGRQAERRADQLEIHVGEGADEDEQDQEAEREAGAQAPIGEVLAPDGLHGHRHAWGDPWSVSGDEGRTDKIERGEAQEVAFDAHAICQRRGKHAAEEIARHVARHIGSERPGSPLGRQVLPEIGDGECEGCRHEDALCHAKKREEGDGIGEGEHGRRHGERSQADPDAASPVDRSAEERNGNAGDGHAEGAGVDGEAHRPPAHLELRYQRRQDGLRGEEVDQCQEGDEPDDSRGNAGLVRPDGLRRPFEGGHCLLLRWNVASPAAPAGNVRVGLRARYMAFWSLEAGGRMSAE